MVALERTYFKNYWHTSQSFGGSPTLAKFLVWCQSLSYLTVPYHYCTRFCKIRLFLIICFPTTTPVMDDTSKDVVGEGRDLLVMLCLAPYRGYYCGIARVVLKSTTQVVSWVWRMANVEQDMLFLRLFRSYMVFSLRYFLHTILVVLVGLFYKMSNALLRQKPDDFAPKLDHVAPGSALVTLSQRVQRRCSLHILTRTRYYFLRPWRLFMTDVKHVCSPWVGYALLPTSCESVSHVFKAVTTRTLWLSFY